MNRVQHRIKDNKKSEIPFHYIFFDTETRSKEIGDGQLQHFLKLGVALYWRRRPDRGKDTFNKIHFTKPGQFWDFVEASAVSKSRLVIVAHNLEFDMGIVKGFRELEKRGYEPTKLIIDNRRQIWKFRKDNKTLLFLDNMNYFTTSLKALGESIDEAKLSMPSPKASKEDWWTYCEQDVNVMLKAWQFWTGFITDNDLGNFGLTIASQAFNAYRHRFMPTPIYIHTSAKACRLERSSYRGGRNECFQIGELPEAQYHLLDINSMYPFVMSNNEYPTNLKSTGKTLSIDALKGYLKDYAVIADCIVNTPEPCFAVKIKGKLQFPIGEFRVTLTSAELRYGLFYGYIKEIYDYALYEKSRLFNDYVNFFYQQRQKFQASGNKTYNYLCKLFLNSLYGKFGQKSEVWEKIGYDYAREYDYWTEVDYESKEIHTFRAVNFVVEERKGYEEGYNSLVAIPAEITANARLYLWMIIKKAGIENCFYCDTDSILLNDTGLHNLNDMISQKDIGMLKIEKHPTKVILRGLKDYIMDKTDRTKGIPKNAIPAGENSFIVMKSIGIRTGLHKKEINNVIWKRTLKNLTRLYNKGIVLSDRRVMPLIMSTLYGENLIDFEALKEAYGEFALFKDRYLDEYMGYSYVISEENPRLMLDYSPADRRAVEIDDQEKRRAGEMIYQRGNH